VVVENDDIDRVAGEQPQAARSIAGDQHGVAEHLQHCLSNAQRLGIVIDAENAWHVQAHHKI
jgi:hypothetical protein